MLAGVSGFAGAVAGGEEDASLVANDDASGCCGDACCSENVADAVLASPMLSVINNEFGFVLANLLLEKFYFRLVIFIGFFSSFLFCC